MTTIRVGHLYPAAKRPVREGDQWRGFRGNREVPPEVAFVRGGRLA
jgi:hypothetical protein